MNWSFLYDHNGDKFPVVASKGKCVYLSDKTEVKVEEVNSTGNYLTYDINNTVQAFTSNYGNWRKFGSLSKIKISLSSPYDIPESIEEFFPTSDLLFRYKNRVITDEEYTMEYSRQLMKLDPTEIAKKVKNNSVLLCYCGKDSFCHRHIVARYLSWAIGCDIKEL